MMLITILVLAIQNASTQKATPNKRSPLPLAELPEDIPQDQVSMPLDQVNLASSVTAAQGHLVVEMATNAAYRRGDLRLLQRDIAVKKIRFQRSTNAKVTARERAAARSIELLLGREIAHFSPPSLGIEKGT